LIGYWLSSEKYSLKHKSFFGEILEIEVIKMTDKMLIGTRASHLEMQKILGHRVRKVSERLNKLIRSAGLVKGVAATRGGIKWTLYEVSFMEYETLIDPMMVTFIILKHGIGWVPLVGIKLCDLQNTLDYLKNKYEKNYDKHEYRGDLIREMLPCIDVLNHEVKLPRKKRY
jgi:hypothetical protein